MWWMFGSIDTYLRIPNPGNKFEEQKLQKTEENCTTSHRIFYYYYYRRKKNCLERFGTFGYLVWSNFVWRNVTWEHSGIPLPLAKLVKPITQENIQYTFTKNHTSTTPDTQIRNSIATSERPTLLIILSLSPSSVSYTHLTLPTIYSV